MHPLVIAAVVLLFVGGIYYLVRQKMNIRKSFEGFAEAHGLRYDHGRYPRVTGTVDDGREFSMGSFQALDDRGRPRNDLPVEFRIRLALRGTLPQGLETGRKGMLDGSPMTLGDAAFDKKVWFTCEDEEAARAYFIPERRQAAIDLADMKGGVAEGAVWIRRSGFKPRQAWMEDHFQNALSAARALDA